jgi:titin
LIDLDGAAVTPGTSGLVIRADNSTVRGLAITGFLIQDPDNPDFSTPGLVIAGSGNVVEADYLGIDPTGTRSGGNAIGVLVSGSDNRIGGKAEEGNLISGNASGVAITGNGNVVQGNDVGTDLTGTVGMGNGFGVAVSGSNNLIGGTTAETRNLISGNSLAGVSVGGNSNRVQGNYLGTDVSGTQALGNGFGVSLGGSNNLVGGTDPGAGNLLSGNRGGGVGITGSNSRVEGNLIGTDVTGTLAVGNFYGVLIEGGTARNNTIGGTASGAGNLISGNHQNGVELTQCHDNVVEGNFIGTDITGSGALGNVLTGVSIEVSALNNQIGGTEEGAGNVISGNGGSGVYIAPFARGNLVQGNLIGTDVSGSQPLGNGIDGVHIDGLNPDIGDNNTIGGEEPGAGNTIAFNESNGVLVNTGTHNAILGNAIFANRYRGIDLINGANLDQQAPLLTSATTDGNSTTVTGTLSSTPDSTFTLELFANSVNDPSGSGEVFLGAVQVTTDADGNASFTVTFDTAYPGMFLTATATDAAHNTSRFSAGVEVTG